MRCLSRMSGNLQVRFLGGGVVVTSPCYPARRVEHGTDVCAWMGALGSLGDPQRYPMRNEPTRVALVIKILRRLPMNLVCLSLFITVAVICLAGLAAVRQDSLDTDDLVFSSLYNTQWLGSLLKSSPSTSASLLWITISTIVAVLLPGLPKAAYFVTAHGLISIINACVIIPMGTAIYFRVKIDCARFFEKNTLNGLGLELTTAQSRAPTRWFWIRQVLLIIAVACIQYFAIGSEITFGLEDTAWIDHMDGVNHLNVFGAMFYALRGVYVYMALALVIHLGRTLSLMAGIKVRPRTHLYTVGYRVKFPVKALGFSLLLGVCAISAIMVTQGLVLLLVVRNSGENTMRVLLSSTWVMWVLVATFGNVLLIGLIQQLQSLLRDEKESIEGMMGNELDRHKPQTEAPATANNSEAALMMWGSYYDARVKLRQVIDSIDTSPLPGGTRGLAGAVLLQLLGVIAAAIGLLRQIR
jgi:hypothetical protein